MVLGRMLALVMNIGTARKNCWTSGSLRFCSASRRTVLRSPSIAAFFICSHLVQAVRRQYDRDARLLHPAELGAWVSYTSTGVCDS
jgi:hypothetical protein